MATEDEIRKSQLRASCQASKSYFSILENQLSSDIERFQHLIDISATQASSKIDILADKLISDFTTAVRREQLDRKSELEKCRKSTNSEIHQSFSDIQSLIDKGKITVEMAEKSFETGSITDIKNDIENINHAKTAITEYLATTRSEVPEMKITLIPPKKTKPALFSPSLGTILAPNVKTLNQKTSEVTLEEQKTPVQNQEEPSTNKMQKNLSRKQKKANKTNRSDEPDAPSHSSQVPRNPRKVYEQEEASSTFSMAELSEDCPPLCKKTERQRRPPSSSDSKNSRQDKPKNYKADVYQKPFQPRIDHKTSFLITNFILNGRTQLDHNTPFLLSLLVLKHKGSIRIVVTDYSNCCLKLFCGRQKNLLNTFVTRTEPCGLTKSHDQQVLATLPKERVILFLDVQDKIRLQKRLQTQNEYYYITECADGSLAVSTDWQSGNGRVELLNQEGHMIKYISNNIILHPRSLTSKGNYLIVVSDNCNRVTCMSSWKTVSWMTVNSLMLNDMANLTTDSEGYIYICDKRRSSVVQLTPEGEIVRDILTSDLTQPEAIFCFEDKVYVTERNGYIKIFQWCHE